MERTMKWLTSILRATGMASIMLASSIVLAQPQAQPTPPEYFGLIMHRLDNGTPWQAHSDCGSWRV